MYCSFYQAAKDLRMTKLADECCEALGKLSELVSIAISHHLIHNKFDLKMWLNLLVS